MEEDAGNFTVPGWARHLATAVWVTDPRQRICCLNTLAEEILGVTAEEVIGASCHELVRAADSKGLAFCSCECPFRQQAECEQAVKPALIRLPRTGRWIHVLGVPVEDPEGGRYIVHCALDPENRYHRLATAGAKVIARRRGDAPLRKRVGLTPREREILRMVAEGLDLHTLARTLHVSYATVRNHVRHILDKLWVHSMREATVVYLLGLEDGAGESEN